jgi:hypothetical protein
MAGLLEITERAVRQICQNGAKHRSTVIRLRRLKAELALDQA